MSVIHSNDFVTTWITGLVNPVRPDSVRFHIELERRGGGAVLLCDKFVALDDARLQVETITTLRDPSTTPGALVCRSCLDEALLRLMQR